MDTTNDAENCGVCFDACGTANASAVACAKSKCIFQCNPGFAHCSSNDADGCNADLTSDNANCGSCSFSCGVEICSALSCHPHVLASGVGHPTGLVVDATNAYFATDDGRIGSVPIGGGPVTFLVTNSPVPFYLALDATYVYFSTFLGRTITRVPIAQGAANDLATDLPSPNGVVVQGSTLFFAVQGDANDGTGQVATIPILGGTVVPLVTGQVGPEQLVIDSTNVYFTNYDNQGRTIMQAPIGGGEAVPLASVASPFGIAVDAKNVYFSDIMGGTISKVPIGGGDTTVLSPAGVSPATLVIDESNVYWVDGGLGEVRSVPIEGGMTRTLATLKKPTGIAIDATSVYATDEVGDQVIRINK